MSTTYEGKEYEVVREGLAEILNEKTEAWTTASKPQSVFYHPKQQINRDLSVLAVRAFAEDLSTIRRLWKEKQSHRQEHGGQKGKKRKRGM